MKATTIFLIGSLVIFANLSIAQDKTPESSCASCHEMLGAPYDSIVQAQQGDIHAKNNISCVDCHGGDPTVMDYDAAKAPHTGFIGKPDPTEIPKLCGSCHADAEYMKRFDPGMPIDQLKKYQTSDHGKLLVTGDTNVAECASCHGAHGILPARDPRSSVYATNVPKTCNTCHGDETHMAEYNIPTDQFDEFQQSVHGVALLENKDIGAPACNDCHGNHGATPPGVTSVSRVCGTCHFNNMELFKESIHKPIFDMMDLPECETCHGNHNVRPPTDAMIGTGEESVCMDCHYEGDAGYALADSMATAIHTLKTVYDSAQSVVERAENKDMDVSDLEYELREVRQKLIQTRTMIHSFDYSKVAEIEQEGQSTGDKIIAGARSLIDEFYYRRKGLGIFTLVITLLVVVFYLKIRQIESNQKK